MAQKQQESDPASNPTGNIQQPLAPPPGMQMGHVPVMMAPPSVQPVVYQVARAPSRRTYENYKSQLSMNLGIIQIICGVLAIILNAVGWHMQNQGQQSEYDYYSQYGSAYSSYYWWGASVGYYICAGFYGPVFFFISGAFAIAAAGTKSRCLVITHLVMSIIAAVFAGLMFCMAIWVVVYDSNRHKEGFQFQSQVFNPNGGYDNNYQTNSVAARYGGASLAVSVLYFLVSIGELVACVWGSTLGCAVCCGTSPTETTNVRYINSPATQQQVVILPTGQNVTSGMPQMTQTMFVQGGPGPTIMAPAAQQPAMTPQYHVVQPPPYQTT